MRSRRFDGRWPRSLTVLEVPSSGKRRRRPKSACGCDCDSDDARLMPSSLQVNDSEFGMPHWQNQHRDTCLDVDSDSSSKSLHRDSLDMPQPSESSPRPGAGPTLPHPRTRRGYTSSAAAPRARPVTVRSGRCEHNRSRRQSSRSARRLSVAGTTHPFKFPPPIHPSVH